MKRILLLLLVVMGTILQANAQYRTQAQQQIFTSEDSLNQGIAKNKTVISGYGSAYYQRNFYYQRAIASLERNVLFVGHQFNSKVYFFSEMELENALVAGTEQKGGLAMEQAFLKFNINARNYIVAGLFIPRIGILNENHLPVNFNGVERNQVESIIIPATWREIGVGFYGSLRSQPLNYSIALMNGLNSEHFSHGTGIRDGRAEGSMAAANNLAVTASLQYSVGNLKMQVSGYMGGTVGIGQRGADSLGLKSGAFGTPVYLGEANLQYNANGVSARILGAYISVPDADDINVAYNANISNSMYGAYGELAYDLLYFKRKKGQLIAFARYEALDMNASLASTTIEDGLLKQTHVVAGFNYMPIPNIAIKADVRLVGTGAQNKALLINPPPNALAIPQNYSLLNIGVGYSF